MRLINYVRSVRMLNQSCCPTTIQNGEWRLLKTVISSCDYKMGSPTVATSLHGHMQVDRDDEAWLEVLRLMNHSIKCPLSHVLPVHNRSAQGRPVLLAVLP